MLDEFLKKSKVKNIVARDCTHFIPLLKRLLNDKNINLLIAGLKMIQNLSKGLKKNFSHCAKNILENVFPKLKDNKPFIVDEAQATIKSLLHSLSVEGLVEEIKLGLEDKAPNMRYQTLKIFLPFISTRDQKYLTVIKQFIDKFITLN